MSCQPKLHVTFEKGDDFNEPMASRRTYGINKLTDTGDDVPQIHWNAIEVYGDEKLRDCIIEMLNKKFEE